MQISRFGLSVIIFFFVFLGCQNDHGENGTDQVDLTAQVEVPPFISDSAYHFVAKQVSFGPRIPNTEAHVECGNWLQDQLSGWADKMHTQEGQIKAYNGKKLNFKNIIASFNPDNKNRIFLCAHWDTRPVADQDPDPERRKESFPGADDGASGVGVLLEVARVLSEKQVGLGVDIILFDVEDYGASGHEDSYCLGSQYWARNPHKTGYSAKYGILLDMVGARGAQFYQEGYSKKFAPSLVRKVWSVAANAGYSGYFKFKDSRGPIVDDHYYINMIAGIPTIDIIHLENNQAKLFGDHWHTHDDNMDIIDKNTLEAVGQTLLQVVYREDAGVF